MSDWEQIQKYQSFLESKKWASKFPLCENLSLKIWLAQRLQKQKA